MIGNGLRLVMREEFLDGPLRSTYPAHVKLMMTSVILRLWSKQLFSSVLSLLNHLLRYQLLKHVPCSIPKAALQWTSALSQQAGWEELVFDRLLVLRHSSAAVLPPAGEEKNNILLIIIIIETY